MHSEEETLIRSFIAPARRPRWLESLALPKKRSAMLNKLNHCRDLDSRYATSLASNTNIISLLRSHGAPEACYVLSGMQSIDGQTMDLADAIAAAEQGGWGTLISCIPARLAYYYDECGERRMLLQRPAGSE